MTWRCPILHISGLDNYALPHPKLIRKPAERQRANASPERRFRAEMAAIWGSDFRAAYVPGTTLTGAGQSVGCCEFDGYYASDITTYESQAGLAQCPADVRAGERGQSALPAQRRIGEVSLDIEMAISMAPGSRQDLRL